MITQSHRAGVGSRRYDSVSSPQPSAATAIDDVLLELGPFSFRLSYPFWGPVAVSTARRVRPGRWRRPSLPTGMSCGGAILRPLTATSHPARRRQSPEPTNNLRIVDYEILALPIGHGEKNAEQVVRVRYVHKDV